MFTGIVKMAHAVKITAPFEAWARELVDGLPGFIAALGPVATLQVDGRTRPIRVESRHKVDAAAAWTLADQSRGLGATNVLVVAQSTTQDARRMLESAGLSYVDTQGHANVRLPGVLIHISNDAPRPRVQDRLSPSRLSSKGGLVAQALLLDPDRSWKIVELAAKCRVSAGLVHRVLSRLEEVGLVKAQGTGPSKVRRLTSPSALLDLWVEEDVEPHVRRRTAYLLAEPGGALARICSARLQAAAVVHAVTGTAAAALLAPVLTAVVVVEIRISGTVALEEAAGAIGARGVEQGANIALIQAITDTELVLRHQDDQGTWMTADTRIYLDAMRDPRRGVEQAKAFRDAAMGY